MPNSTDTADTYDGPVLEIEDLCLSYFTRAGEIPAVGTTGIVTGRSVLGGEPDAALAVFEDLIEIVADESVFCGETGEILAIVAADAPLGTEPQMPLPILQYRMHVIVDQAVLGGEGGKLLAVIIENLMVNVYGRIRFAK